MTVHFSRLVISQMCCRLSTSR